MHTIINLCTLFATDPYIPYCDLTLKLSEWWLYLQKIVWYNDITHIHTSQDYQNKYCFCQKLLIMECSASPPCNI